MEIEDYQLDPAYLLGRIQALERMVHVLVGMLPEEHRDHIGRRLHVLYRDAEIDATRADTDTTKSRRDGVYHTYTSSAPEDEAQILKEMGEENGRTYQLKT